MLNLSVLEVTAGHLTVTSVYDDASVSCLLLQSRAKFRGFLPTSQLGVVSS